MEQQQEICKICAVKHEGEIFAYCKTDGTYLCETCYQGYHRGHVVEFLKYIARDHVTTMEELERVVGDTVSSCGKTLHENGRSNYVEYLKETIKGYYNSLIERLKEDCRLVIEQTLEKLKPSVSNLDHACKNLSARKDELTFLNCKIKQENKFFQQCLNVHKFRHFHEHQAKMNEIKQKVLGITEVIERGIENIHRCSPKLGFSQAATIISAQIRDGISFQDPALLEGPVPEEEVKRNPVAIEERKLAPSAPPDSDTIKFFKVLNEIQEEEKLKTPKRPSARPSARRPRDVRKSAPQGKNGTPVRPYTPDAKKQTPKKVGVKPIRSKVENWERVFSLDPINKQIHFFYPATQESDSLVLLSASPLPEGFAIVELSNGKIILTGGEKAKQVINDVTEIHETRRSFVKRKSMLISRRNHGMVSCADWGYSVGGYNKLSVVLRKCERYCYEKDIWQELPELLEERNFLSCCVIDRRYVYVFGGNQAGPDDREATYEVLDTELITEWRSFQIDASGGKVALGFSIGCAQVGPSEILLFGGLSKNEYYNTSYFLNTETGALASTGSILRARDAFYQRHPVYFDKKIYCFGYWSKFLHIFDLSNFKWLAQPA